MFLSSRNTWTILELTDLVRYLSIIWLIFYICQSFRIFNHLHGNPWSVKPKHGIEISAELGVLSSLETFLSLSSDHDSQPVQQLSCQFPSKGNGKFLVLDLGTACGCAGSGCSLLVHFQLQVKELFVFTGGNQVLCLGQSRLRFTWATNLCIVETNIGWSQFLLD